MQRIARLTLKKIVKLAMAVVSKILVYSLVIVLAISIILLPLAIMNYLNNEDNVMWVASISALLMALHINFIA